MNDQIKKALLNGRLVLFFGAGASKSSLSKSKNPLLDGAALAHKIAETAGWQYKGESLSTVYAAARSTVPKQIDSLFTELFQHCKPSSDYEKLAKYPWARIYTTNIDDALDVALRKHSPQKICIKSRNDSVEAQDAVFSRMDFIKLNGSSDKPDEGFIFSPQEYGKSAAKTPVWYKELGSDFFQYTFIFIGTKLDEPLFYHQIEHYRSVVTTGAPRSYVITPSATEIEVASLRSLNLDHIAEGLEGFVAWLEKEVPTPPLVLDLAFAANPSLRELFKLHAQKDKEEYADLLKGVVPVSRTHLEKSEAFQPVGTIRDFYRGFKPSWRDILDEVPAQLGASKRFFELVQEKATPGKIIALFGPAGCGKSTLVKQTGIRLADQENRNVYFIGQPQEKFSGIIAALEAANNDPYYLLIDRLDAFREDLKEVFSGEKMLKGIIIGCEGQSIWQSRLRPNIEKYCAETFHLADIIPSDADLILDKIEQYGPWTRLAQLNKKQRKAELLEKSKKQLLIGLLETISGAGFEQIIAKDFSSLSETARTFVVLVCLCNVHRQSAIESLMSRALATLGVTESPSSMSHDLSGTVGKQAGGFMARHPVYARQIISSVVDIGLLEACIRAIIEAFTVFPHPVVANLDRPQAIIFKSIINHKFLRDVLRDNQKRIVGVYRGFEKYFENDGLFWLQYGLAMRDFGQQEEAYEKLVTAYNAYPHDHTSHALAQQELILASLESTTDTKASDLLASATKKLEHLDRILKSDDTYPIVTLAEGHTKVIIKTEGIQLARVVAKSYCDRLERRMRSNPDQRLKEAYNLLLKLVTTGVWAPEYGSE